MFRKGIDGEKENDRKTTAEGTAGQKLKIIFHQDDRFARIEEQPASESLLMNPLRLSIFLHLFKNPCDHTRSIARGIGEHLSSVNWNLGRLAGKGYVENRMIEGRKAYWPAGMVEEEDVAAVSMLRSPLTISVLKIIRNAGGRSRERDIVSMAGTSQQNLHFRLGKLVFAGLLERKMDGLAPVYSVGTGLNQRVRFYDSRSKAFSKITIACLKKDGLMPKHPRLRRSRLSVDVSLPVGRRRLHLECNPMANARPFLYSVK